MPTSLSEFLGEWIYIDTSLFHHLIRPLPDTEDEEERERNRATNEAIRDFFRRLELGEFTAVTSLVMFTELANSLGGALSRDNVAPSEKRDKLAKVIQYIYDFPNLQIVSVRKGDLLKMVRNIKKHDLYSADALHLAVMQRLGCSDMATNDKHFEQVDIINIFAPRV